MRPVRRIIVWGLRFWTGAATGIMLHYTLYRMGLPLEPFIYQAF